MKLLQGSFFLKIAALVFAIISYTYIRNEIRHTEKKVSDPSYKLIKLTAKSLPLKLRLDSSPPEGYRILEDKVMTQPTHVIVIGPEALLEEAYTAETRILDVSESTKTVVKKIPLENVAGISLSGEPYLVEVTVPIEKIETPPPAAAAPPDAEPPQQ